MLSDAKRRRLEREAEDRFQNRLEVKKRSLELCRSCLEASIEFDSAPFGRVAYWAREIALWKAREIRREAL